MKLIPMFRQLVAEKPDLNIQEYIYLLSKLPDSPWITEEARKKARTELNRELQDGCLSDVWYRVWWIESDRIPGRPLQHPPAWAVKTIEEGRVKKTEISPPEAREDVADDIAILRDYAIEHTADTKFARMMQHVASAVARGEFDARAILQLFGTLGHSYATERRVHEPLVKVGELYERQITTINEKHALEVKLLTSDDPRPSPAPVYQHTRQ